MRKVRGGRKIDSSVKASAIHSPVVVSLINLIVLHFSKKLSEKTAKVGSSSSIARVVLHFARMLLEKRATVKK